MEIAAHSLGTGKLSAMAMRNILQGYRQFDIDLYRLRSKNFHADMLHDRAILMQDMFSCLRADADFSCVLCEGERKSEYLDWQGYKLFECLDCGAVSANIDSTKLSDRSFHQKAIVQSDLEREIVATYDYRKETFARERLAYLKELITDFGTQADNVLDVGCGPGYFLDYLKEHQIPGSGLEVNPFCVSFCNARGLDVRSHDLAEEQSESYSLITMFDVLEHLDEPCDVMMAARRALRPGGHILAYTPNIHSISVLLMKGEHNSLLPFNHRCFYDPKSLNYLSTKAGLEVVRCEYYGLDIIDYFAMMEARNGVPYFGDLRAMVAPLQALIDKQGLSNSMRILFRKTD